MATNTTIEWADKTWSPLIGCDRVSPGCDHCYAISTARIRSFNPNPKVSLPFAGTVDRTDAGVDWTGKVNLLDERLTEPMRWRKPARVFVNSMSDLFHKDVPVDFIAKVFGVMALTPQHTYQILTKRHARMRSVLSSEAFQLAVLAETARQQDEQHPMPSWLPGSRRLKNWPLPNVWLGVSVENQKWADIRVPALLETPAAVRFLSCEPLLGPIDLWGPLKDGHHRPMLTYWLDGRPQLDEGHTTPTGLTMHGFTTGPSIDWVIVGGESGHGARAMHPQWVRTIRDQCQQSGVAFLFKQWGEWGPAPFIVRVCDPQVGWTGTDDELAEAKRQSEAAGATHVHTGNWFEENGERKFWLHEIGHKPWSRERAGLPDGHEPIRRWGKKRAGRELDGRTWDEFPDGAL